ncbi:MAG: rod shape-determining protein, partial [Syntrophaceae bacterium]|nr:rod shape-determining protein [Syntrophaceae bacterium]
MNKMFSRLKQIMRQPSIAVDLGTANTRIFSSELGQIKEKPSLIRYKNDAKTKLVSDDYLSYLNSKLFFMPLRGGVIVDFNNAINLLRPLLKETRKGLRHPISLASAPTDTSEKERELLAKAVLAAGASHVAIIPEVWAAAIGAGMDVNSPYAQVLIDIGEGVTDLAVIRDGRLIYASAVRTACSELQKAVRSVILSRYKVYICPAETERLTHTISSISQEQIFNPKLITVSGNDIFKGRKVTITVNEQDIISALEPVIDKILKMIELNLRKLSKPASSEILESGICLSGGGACIS